jgi:hypothetical protein
MMPDRRLKQLCNMARDWFAPSKPDEIADLRPGLGRLMRRAIESGGWYQIDLFRCSLLGQPIGNWRVTVERIEATGGDDGTV